MVPPWKVQLEGLEHHKGLDSGPGLYRYPCLCLKKESSNPDLVTDVENRPQ